MAVSVDFMATQETDDTKKAAVKPVRSASSVDKWTFSSAGAGAGSGARRGSSKGAPSSGSVLLAMMLRPWVTRERGDCSWVAGVPALADDLGCSREDLGDGERLGARE